MNIDSGIDYRLRVLQQAELYVSPLTKENIHWLANRFTALSNNQHIIQDPIHINGRYRHQRSHRKTPCTLIFGVMYAAALKLATLLKSPTSLARCWWMMCPYSTILSLTRQGALFTRR